MDKSSMAVLERTLKLTSLSKEELVLLVQSNYVVILVALLFVAVTFLVSSAWTRATTSDAADRIPGRLGLPFVGETLSFLSATNSTKGSYEFVRLRRLWYGNWFKTRILGKIQVFVPTPEGARKIFSNDFVEFNKGYFKSMKDLVGKESVFAAPHETHERIRHLLSDPFSMPSLSIFVKQFDQMLTRRLKKLEERGKSFRMLDFTLQLTFDAMCNMMFSLTDQPKLRQLDNDCSLFADGLISFPFMIPRTRYYKGVKARQRLMETFQGIIDGRKSGKEYHDDFMQSILENPSKDRLTDSEIKDNLLTMLLAGQSSSSAAMMWSVKFLDENQEVQDKLREEQLSIAKKKKDGDVLSLEDLNSMVYASKVVKETLRMSNPVVWLPRVAITDCTVDGVEIKKGWYVNVDATHIHFDPALYKDPMQFNPSRFDGTQIPYSFIPYGSGPRTCLGINMAKVTMLVFLHRLTGGYKWTVDDPDPSLEEGLHIPRLKSGCPVTLKALNDERIRICEGRMFYGTRISSIT